jgi:hypothetical protein
MYLLAIRRIVFHIHICYEFMLVRFRTPNFHGASHGPTKNNVS